MSDIKKISLNKQRKVETVSTLKQKLEKAKTFFLTDYRGLTHQQLEQLRKALKKVEAEFLIAKNTLLKLAIKSFDKTQDKHSIEQLEKELNNPTAAFLAYGDEIAPVRELAKFIKTFQLPKIKLGIFSGKLATETEFMTLSSLPAKDVLLATLANRLQSPISGLHYALNWNLQRFVTVLEAIKGKKPALA